MPEPMENLANRLELESKENEDLNKQEELETEKVTPELITEEFAKENGLSKHMIGKPIKELGTAYKELNKFNTQLSQKFKDAEKLFEEKFASLESKLTAKEAVKVEEKVEQKVEEQIGKMPIPLDFDTDADYEKAMMLWLDKRDSIKQKTLIDALEKKFGEKFNPHITKIDKYEQEKLEEQGKKDLDHMADLVDKGIKDLFNNELPEGFELDTLLNEWQDSVEKKYSKERLAAMYGGKPEVMAEDILMFQKSKLFDQSRSSVQSEKEKARLLEEAKQKNVNKIKSKTDSKATQAGTSQRAKESDDKPNHMGNLADRLQKQREFEREK
jgi:hypothetical protein